MLTEGGDRQLGMLGKEIGKVAACGGALFLERTVVEDTETEMREHRFFIASHFAKGGETGNENVADLLIGGIFFCALPGKMLCSCAERREALCAIGGLCAKRCGGLCRVSIGVSPPKSK